MKQVNLSNRPRALGEKDISSQFQGMEVEFNEKVTLFPVQVEKKGTHRRRSSQRRIGGRSDV